ncbi:MAG: CehA/McbA family metallohydrolase, partial [Rhodospirillales bacterium]
MKRAGEAEDGQEEKRGEFHGKEIFFKRKRILNFNQFKLGTIRTPFNKNCFAFVCKVNFYGNIKMKYTYALFFILSIGLFSISCSTSRNGPATKWYRGNTHTHTSALRGHAKTSPKDVTAWYHKRDYNFLILSEHDLFIDPKKVEMPKNKRNDFILIPGIELSEELHGTCMNVPDKVKKISGKGKTNKQIIQSQVDRTLDIGGQFIHNHPNWLSRVKKEDIEGIKNLTLFEHYNGTMSVEQTFGSDEFESTQVIWDHLLGKGDVMYAVAADDAHSHEPGSDAPGRGWVMVNAQKAKELTPKAITDAMLHGEFYASSGVFLDNCDFDNGTYRVVINKEATIKELANLAQVRGKPIKNGKAGFRIEWIEKSGKVFKTTTALSSFVKAKKDQIYIRPRIVYTRKNLKFGWEEYFAWGQPQFMDGRTKKSNHT